MKTHIFHPIERETIRLAMLGMVDGNGHPYSWSAIFNGYDPAAMASCPYAAIPAYLDREPKESLQIPGARVTHIWTDDPSDAARVADTSLIPHVVEAPEDVIGAVDAVIVATDKGWEHVERCRPFVEAGLPVFVDKPLADSMDDLAVFRRWVEEGRPVMSSSCMRYCREFMPFRASTRDLGELRYLSITTPKSWERYGIHALEGMYPIAGPGFVSARHTGSDEHTVVVFRHRSGLMASVAAIHDMYGAFGVLTLCGTTGHASASFSDTFFAFKAQLEAFVTFLRTGERPFPFAETAELVTMIAAGIRSREDGGREVFLKDM